MQKRVDTNRVISRRRHVLALDMTLSLLSRFVSRTISLSVTGSCMDAIMEAALWISS